MHSASAVLFVCVLARKMLNFPPEVAIWWTLNLKMYVYYWEVSVRVMGLVGLLLHYNASNLVLEILKHDKILGDNLH